MRSTNQYLHTQIVSSRNLNRGRRTLHTSDPANMAGVSYTKGVVSHFGEISAEELAKLKDEIRPCFIELDCNLRVLGSQLGLKTSELNDLDRRSERDRTDFKELLLDECFKKEKIVSWHQFVTVLEKPALAQNSITKDIRSRFLRQYSSESDSSLPSPMSIQSAHPGLSSLEASFSSRMEVETGGKYKSSYFI